MKTQRNLSFIIIFLASSSSQSLAQVWERLQNLGTIQVSTITSSPVNPDLLLVNDRFRTTDAGLSWDTIRLAVNQRSFQLLAWHPTEKDKFLCNLFIDSLTFVMSSTDGGLTFEKAFFPRMHSLEISRANPQRLFSMRVYGGGQGIPRITTIERSSDGGATWNIVELNWSQYVTGNEASLQEAQGPTLSDTRKFALDPVDAAKVYQYYQWSDSHDIDGENFSVSNSFGDDRSFIAFPSWNYDISISSHLRTPHAIYINPMNTNQIIVAGKKLRMTMDAGVSWVDIDPAQRKILTSAVDWTAGAIYIGGELGVKRSINGGTTWIDLNDGFLVPQVNALHITSDGSLYAGTRDGLYRFNMAVGIDHFSLPNSLSIEQNYPNPFSTSTTIRFTITSVDDRNHSRVSVLDVLGREIAMLFVGRMTSSSMSLVFTPRDIPSGVYQVRLTSGGKTTHRTMTYMGK